MSDHNEIYISRFSAWAPGIETKQDREEWAQGKREMICSKESPEIKFTDPMFRRRLSQISKMTIQVVHDLLPIKENTKMLFVSFRGEINKQFSINKTQIEEGTISPAVFSSSVFNAPVALASMALNLKGGYTAVYPSDNYINAGLSAAAAMLNTDSINEELVFIYADENIPEEYSCFVPESLPPFAFSLLLTKKQSSDSIIIPMDDKEVSPKDFLKSILLRHSAVS